jgi:uncharacterized membrane protein
MAALTVLKFPAVNDAAQALSTLEELQEQRLITIIDAATVAWPEGKKQPKTTQMHNLAGAGALSGAFWGLLFGLLFFLPFIGVALGATVGAISGAFTDIGIDDRFIKEVRAKITPGTSALFLLSGGAVMERIGEAFQGREFELIASNLTTEEEARLMEYFSEE